MHLNSGLYLFGMKITSIELFSGFFAPASAGCELLSWSCEFVSAFCAFVIRFEMSTSARHPFSTITTQKAGSAFPVANQYARLILWFTKCSTASARRSVFDFCWHASITSICKPEFFYCCFEFLYQCRQSCFE